MCACFWSQLYKVWAGLTFPYVDFLAEGSKIGADVMDRKRKEHMAYEYLCHLEEAKK